MGKCLTSACITFCLAYGTYFVLFHTVTTTYVPVQTFLKPLIPPPPIPLMGNMDTLYPKILLTTAMKIAYSFIKSKSLNSEQLLTCLW